MDERPAKPEGLSVAEVDDGLVVRVPGHSAARHLNQTAAFIFESCNGANLSSDIVRMVQIAYALDDPPDEVVHECLRQLRADGLLR